MIKALKRKSEIKILFSQKSCLTRKIIKKIAQLNTFQIRLLGAFPPKIWHAKLINAKDLSHCSPIVRTITFIKKDTKCFSDLGKGMYLIKTKQYIVGYESWTS